MLSIIVSISDLYFTLLSIFKTSEYKHFSTKIDKFSIAVPHPLVQNLSIFVEKCLYLEALKIESRVKYKSEILTIIDNLNKSKTLTSDCRLVSFDIINMFPSVDNISGLKAVKSILDARQDQFPPTACIVETLKLCLECNNSILNNKHF